MTNIICKECGNIFIKQNERHIFCCNKCRATYRNKRISNETKKIRETEEVCNYCNSIFVRKSFLQKYCSKKCQEQHNDRVLKRKHLKILNCKFCNKEFKQHDSRQLFCCREHMLKFHKNKKSESIREKSRLKKIQNKQIEKEYAKCRRICKDIVRCILGNNKRYIPSKIILGYSKQDFHKHIESKFQEGMTWDNHGKVWHVDHIRPFASFILSDTDIEYNINVAKICNQLDNLQPLFVFDNLSKLSWYRGYFWRLGYPIFCKNNGKRVYVKDEDKDRLRKELIPEDYKG